MVTKVSMIIFLATYALAYLGIAAAAPVSAVAAGVAAVAWAVGE